MFVKDTKYTIFLRQVRERKEKPISSDCHFLISSLIFKNLYSINITTTHKISLLTIRRRNSLSTPVYLLSTSDKPFITIFNNCRTFSYLIRVIWPWPPSTFSSLSSSSFSSLFLNLCQHTWAAVSLWNPSAPEYPVWRTTTPNTIVVQHILCCNRKDWKWM